MPVFIDRERKIKLLNISGGTQPVIILPEQCSYWLVISPLKNNISRTKETRKIQNCNGIDHWFAILRITTDCVHYLH